jgi:hypothetical protein
MQQLYPEQIPSDVWYDGVTLVICIIWRRYILQVESRARELAKEFQKDRFVTKREINNLSRLAADATDILPPDFVSVRPSSVAAHVRTCIYYLSIFLTFFLISFRQKKYLQRDSRFPWYYVEVLDARV